MLESKQHNCVDCLVYKTTITVIILYGRNIQVVDYRNRSVYEILKKRASHNRKFIRKFFICI